MTIRLMQGNEAIALGAIAAGCRFFAGYPITPSTEVAEILARELPRVGGGSLCQVVINFLLNPADF